MAKIKIDKALYDRVADVAKKGGYSSTDEIFLPYYALIDRVSESGGGANPFSPEFMVNFAIAGGVWCASYYSAMPSRRTFP